VQPAHTPKYLADLLSNYDLLQIVLILSQFVVAVACSL
jgi:hypothetical protein